MCMTPTGEQQVSPAVSSDLPEIPLATSLGIASGSPQTPQVSIAPPTVLDRNMQWADPSWKDKLTVLKTSDEAKYQQWAHANKVPQTADYDMRGFWKDPTMSTSVNQNDHKIHYNDKYKTPLHESFSNESKFVTPSQRNEAPRWNKAGLKKGEEAYQLMLPNGRVILDEKARESQRSKSK